MAASTKHGSNKNTKVNFETWEGGRLYIASQVVDRASSCMYKIVLTNASTPVFNGWWWWSWSSVNCISVRIIYMQKMPTHTSASRAILTENHRPILPKKSGKAQIFGANISYLTHISTLSKLAWRNVRASRPTHTRSIEVSPWRMVWSNVVPEPSWRKIGRALEKG